MTKPEIRINDEARMTKRVLVRHSSFGFDSSFWFRHSDFPTTAAPHGLSPHMMLETSFIVATSTTDTSFDGPFATKRNFSSGDIAIPHARMPTFAAPTT